MAQRKKATITGPVSRKDDRTGEVTTKVETRELVSADWVTVPSGAIAKVYGDTVAKKDAELRVLFEATAKVKAEIEALINAQVPVTGPYQLLYGYRGGISVAKADKRTTGASKSDASSVQAILKRLQAPNVTAA